MFSNQLILDLNLFIGLRSSSVASPLDMSLAIVLLPSGVTQSSCPHVGIQQKVSALLTEKVKSIKGKV